MIKLEKDVSQRLEANDIVFLLVSLYPIRFELDTRPPLPSTSSLDASNAVSDGEMLKEGLGSASKKRPHSEVSGGSVELRLSESMDDSDDEDCIVLTKKPKLQEEPAVAPSPKIEIPASNHWSGGLLAYTKDPSKFEDVVIKYTDDWVAIKDKYPKALLHLLILPRSSIPSLSHLTPAHIPLLESIFSVATELGTAWLSGTLEKDVSKKLSSPSASTSRVNIGVHAVPSMSQIHIHVISDDFDSPSLKNKKHWNSFQPPFFIPVPSILDTLRKGEKISFNKDHYDKYLEQPLRCHRCNATMSNLPSLKTHIASCPPK